MSEPHNNDGPPGRKRFCGVKGRSGPPKGNRNALRHGLKNGQLPKDAKFIEIRLNIFRRQVEDAVLACKGEINLPDAGSIQTAMRWERHAALAQRWLNKAYADLKPAERLNFSREIARASTERDKAIAMLRLDTAARDDLLENLYSRLPAPTNGVAEGLEDKK